jgi:8-oxo-dGTP diphosphatase
MRIVDGEFTPNREVDEIVWLSADEAATRLTYEHDRALTVHVGRAHRLHGEDQTNLR